MAQPNEITSLDAGTAVLFHAEHDWSGTSEFHCSVMKRFRHIFAAFVVVHGCQCLAAASPYYRDFLKASADKRPPFQIASVSSVDTNNCSPTVGRGPISLAPGGLGGVRLGMTMDEVVSLWGKPLCIGCCRSNYPAFSFDDAWVRFEKNQV